MDFDLKILALLVSFIINQVESVSNLRCYACNQVKDYRTCETDDQVISCGELADAADTSYNRCATETFDYQNGTVRYTKRCVVGPCILENKDQNTVLHVAQCNPLPGGKGTSCMKCCPDNKCNLGSGTSKTALNFILLPLISLTTYAL